MTSIFSRLTVATVLLAASLNLPACASDRPGQPSAASIETLLREALASDAVELPSLIPFKEARLMKFELVELDPGSSGRWHVESDLQFDFGPLHPSVVGFERIRSGRYRMVLKRKDAGLELIRFYPVGSVRPLPGRA